MVMSDRAIYEDFYLNQSGGSFYSGRSYIPRQRGEGIGNFLRSAARFITPLLVRGGKVLGKKLLKTGVGIAEDVIDGQNVRDSAKVRFSDVGRDLLSEITSPNSSSTNKRGTKRRRVIARNGVKRRRVRNIFS